MGRVLETGRAGSGARFEGSPDIKHVVKNSFFAYSRWFSFIAPYIATLYREELKRVLITDRDHI